MPTVSKPSPLQLAAFASTALGALLIGVGALRPWVTVGFGADRTGALDSQIFGIDIAEGKAELAIAIGLLAGILALRIIRSRTARRAISALILLAGLAAAGIAIADIARLHQRFDVVGIDAVAKTVAAKLHQPMEQARREVMATLEKLGGARVGAQPAMFVALGGGLLAALGGGLSLAWVSGTEGSRWPDQPEPEELGGGEPDEGVVEAGSKAPAAD